MNMAMSTFPVGRPSTACGRRNSSRHHHKLKPYKRIGLVTCEPTIKLDGHLDLDSIGDFGRLDRFEVDGNGSATAVLREG